MILVDREHSEGSGGGGSVSCEALPLFSSTDEAVVVEVVLPLAGVACGDAAAAHGERFAAHGDGRRVEAVGAFAVVGVEDGWLRECAISHDDAVIVAQDERPPRVHRVLDAAAARPAVVGEVEPCRPVAHGSGHLAEDAGGHRVHRTGKGGVLVDAVVEDEIAGAGGELVLRVAAGGGEQGKSKKDTSHDKVLLLI